MSIFNKDEKINNDNGRVLNGNEDRIMHTPDLRWMQNSVLIVTKLGDTENLYLNTKKKW